jgi:hypothetical protein
MEKPYLPANMFVSEQGGGTAGSRLNIAVIFTSIESTLSALRRAGALANRPHACITLVVTQVVPYPLPLNRPPVSPDFRERHFRVLAEESAVETTVRIYLCRDRVETLRKVLKPHSLVVIGGVGAGGPRRRIDWLANYADPAMR